MSDNRGPQVSGVSALFLALTWVFIAMRVYCRLVVVKGFGLDDYLAVLAQLIFTVFCAFGISGVQYGMGTHTWDIQPTKNISTGLKRWWMCELAYVLSSLAIKLSICVFLLRIVVSRAQRLILWTVMGICGAASTYFFFLFVFQCWPVAYFWAHLTGMHGSCIDRRIITGSTYMYSAVSCWADWTCCILPAFVVWNLQMNPRTKISVLLILALSAIASVATIVRIPYLHNLTNVDDFLYATTDLAIWSIAEIGLAIMASAAATLRPLFRNFLSRSRLFGGTTREVVSLHSLSPAGSRRNLVHRKHEQPWVGSDVGNRVGITTVIKCQPKTYSKYEVPNHKTGHRSKFHAGRTEEVRSEASAQGIRKTIVVSTDWASRQDRSI